MLYFFFGCAGFAQVYFAGNLSNELINFRSNSKYKVIYNIIVMIQIIRLLKKKVLTVCTEQILLGCKEMRPVVQRTVRFGVQKNRVDLLK